MIRTDAYFRRAQKDKWGGKRIGPQRVLHRNSAETRCGETWLPQILGERDKTAVVAKVTLLGGPGRCV